MITTAIIYFAIIFQGLAPVNFYRDTDEIRDEFIRREQQEFYANELDRFLNHLAIRESSDDWKVYNPWGYIGKYQIGRAARIDTGYGHISFNEFVRNPEIFSEHDQREAVIRLMKINYSRLMPMLEICNGVVVGGIELTPAGMLAGAHLAGAYNVRRYIMTDGKFNPRDALGTRLSDYLQEFAGYNLKVTI